MTWDWNEEGIGHLEVSEDIVEFLVQNTLQGAIHKDTIEILKFAACLGNREFNTSILSNVFDVTPQEAIIVRLQF
jgi:predicted ATPase